MTRKRSSAIRGKALGTGRGERGRGERPISPHNREGGGRPIKKRRNSLRGGHEPDKKKSILETLLIKRETKFKSEPTGREEHLIVERKGESGALDGDASDQSAGGKRGIAGRSLWAS